VKSKTHLKPRQSHTSTIKLWTEFC